MCQSDALNYKTRNEWSLKSGKMYRTALYYGWLDDCCKHMKAVRDVITFDMCLEDAKHYKTRNEWQRNSKSKYSAARSHGWLEACCAHMEVSDWFKSRQQAQERTFEFCKQDALKHTSRSEWKRKSLATYETARRNGWLEECCKHIPKRRK
jgi:hypothetical protein